MLWIIIGIIISYLIGSIPTAYIFGRLLKGIDIRQFGSGNVGATNALRVLGRGPGIAVLALDILKGFVAVVLVGNFISSRTFIIGDEAIEILFGVSCILGHNWTVFLKFKGGKGIAATLGVLIGLATQIADLKSIVVVLLITWLIVFFLARIVSIASVISAIFLPLYMVLFKQSKLLVISSLFLTLFIILRHRSNLRRFFQGKEPKLTFKK